MKKFCALLLALVMIFALAACSGSTPSASPPSSPSAPSSPSTPASAPIKVDIFWYTYSDTYLTSVRNAMQSDLDKVSSIKYSMFDCESDQAKQTQMVETALTQGTDLLIVNIVTTGSEEAAQNICNLAKAKNIPIIFFNREVSDAVVNSYDKCCFVGTDADEAGYMEGQAAAEYLLSGDNLKKYDLDGNKEIAYIMFRGEHGNAEAFGRTKYSVEEANRLLAASGYKLVPSKANSTSTQYDDDGISNYFLYGNWQAPEAANLMRTALSQYSLTDGSIELIFANNDDQALGAIEAMNESGFNTGDAGAGYIPVFGVDATSAAQEAISAGKMTGTVLQDAKGMAECIALLATNVSTGQSVMFSTGKFTNIDNGVAKIRIPYAIVK